MTTLLTSLPDGSYGDNYISEAHSFPRGRRVSLSGKDYIIDRVTWEGKNGAIGILHLMYEDEWEEEMLSLRNKQQKYNILWMIAGAALAVVIFLLLK